MSYDQTFHELIVAVKDLTSELGREPTQQEFFASGKATLHQIRQIRGGFTVLLQAAGLKTYRKPKKPTNDIFVRDLPETLAEHVPAERVAPPQYTPTLVIPDTHFPFVSLRVLEQIYKFVESHKPRRIIQLGDLYDMYAHTKFPRSHNVYMPDQEEDLGRKGAEDMWKTLRGLSPEAECIQLKGNHDVRAVKRALEVTPALERAVKKHVDDLMTFEGVKLISDPRQEFIVEGIEFIHGYRSGLGQHRDYALMNAVCGHIHVGGVSFKRFRGQTFWELNAGLAGDPESKAFSYTPQKITHWTPGFGWLDEYGPRFIPA